MDHILYKLAAPTIKNIHDMKVVHGQSSLLVKRMCKIVIDKGNHDIVWKIFGSAIATAVKYGTYELIEECIVTYPGIIWYDVGGFYLFLAAIKERQERVYNLVHQMSRHKIFAATHLDSAENDYDNPLHVAARLAPSHRLNVVTGAALQMQRELQWFEVIIVVINESIIMVVIQFRFIIRKYNKFIYLFNILIMDIIMKILLLVSNLLINRALWL